MRFTLRPPTQADAPSLARYADNIRIWDMVRDRFPHPYTEQDALAYIDAVLGDSSSPLFVIDLDGQAIGTIGVRRGEDVERIGGEIGYWLGEEHWGMGIATEAVRQMCAYTWNETDMIHIFATVAHNNPASMRVLTKAGFSPVGVRRRAAIKNNQIIDIHYFELNKIQ